MTDFTGFAITGYRSMFGEPQWIPVGDDVTVVLGANNAGKSNVLRLLHLHLADIYSAVRSTALNSSIGGFDPRLDQPRGHDAHVEVHWPVDVGALAEAGVSHEDVEALSAVPSLSRFGRLTVPLYSEGLDARLEAPLDAALTIKGEAGNVPWGKLSSTLTSSRGGANGADVQRVLEWLRPQAIEPPQTVFVPPSRTLRPGDPTEEWDFGGEGVIERLHRMLNPDFDENDLREQALALRNDLRVLLEDQDLDFEVPHDRSTVNVKLRGEYYPLSSLGTGTGHAVLILAARHIFPDRLLCIEEPDAHLHPRLQRRLMSLLRDPGLRQLVVATHSAHIIDTTSDIVLAVQEQDGRSLLRCVGDPEIFEQLRVLGYRASDLLQSNAVIWVEGPSDRIYLLHWLRHVASDLVEGVDFSIAFYGGALLSRLSGAETGPTDPTLVDLWRINQRMWLVMDSDLGEGDLKPAVQRLSAEVSGSANGGVWVTDGYTIENYIPRALLVDAAREVHPTVTGIKTPQKNRDPLKRLQRRNGTLLKHVDKVAIAVAVASAPAETTVLDLADRIEELVRFIRGDS